MAMTTPDNDRMTVKTGIRKFIHSSSLTPAKVQSKMIASIWKAMLE